MAKIKGIAVEMGGTEWVVPPLTFRQIRDLQSVIARIAAMSGMPGPEHIAAVAELVRTGLSRNYPDLTVEAVEDLLDMGNFGAVLMAVLRGSGLAEPGEGKAAGI